MHKNQSNNFLGETIGEEGYGSIEIDESTIVGNSNITYWMFGLVHRETKEARVYCVLNDRSKNNLIPIIKRNVITNYNEDEDYPDLNEENSTKTRIYSDCWSTYQVKDFNQLGYILRRVNHQVWFGYGLFHTNTIETVWGHLKNNINMLNSKFGNNQTLLKNYFDGWICYSLFIREVKRRLLSWSDRINLLCNYLKIN